MTGDEELLGKRSFLRDINNGITRDSPRHPDLMPLTRSLSAAPARLAYRQAARWTQSMRGLATLATDKTRVSTDFEAPPPPSKEIQDARHVFRQAVAATTARNNWTREEISGIYHQPLLELSFQAVSLPSILLYLGGSIDHRRALSTVASTIRPKSSSVPS
jgi:hypothetical protein